jgi:hypothetical protein
MSSKEKDLGVYAETLYQIWRCRTHAAASEAAAYSKLLGSQRDTLSKNGHCM